MSEQSAGTHDSGPAFDLGYSLERMKIAFEKIGERFAAGARMARGEHTHADMLDYQERMSIAKYNRKIREERRQAQLFLDRLITDWEREVML